MTSTSPSTPDFVVPEHRIQLVVNLHHIPHAEWVREAASSPESGFQDFIHLGDLDYKSYGDMQDWQQDVVEWVVNLCKATKTRPSDWLVAT